MFILVLIYVCAGYWAVGKTVYAKYEPKNPGVRFARKFLSGILFGWALIPVAVIKMLLNRQ